MARAMLGKAIRDGLLTKPKICKNCGGSNRRIEAHHFKGYEREHWYTVEWLCSRCHRLAHRPMP
jgi:hypothetical protein